MESAEFQQYYGMLPEPMLLVSPEGEILACNPAANELFDRAKLAGAKLHELTVDPEPKLNRFLLHCRRTRELLPGVVTVRRCDGCLLPCHVEGAALTGSGSAQLLLRLLNKEKATTRFIALNERIEALNKQIVERQRAEAALASTNEALRRANLDLEQFAYSAAHDLREPLRMIALYIDLIRRKYLGRLDAQGDEYLGFAVEGARRMQALITDLLAYTQAVNENKEPPREPTAADLALDLTLTNLRTAIEESGATIKREPLPKLLVEEVHLVQLFQNLVGNALKYRGEVAPVIHICADREGEKWRISVCDNGIGIAPEYADRIFGLFRRLHTTESYSGTGLGLAICQKIIHRYGGRIWVESDGEGRGSTFRFIVPGAESLSETGRPQGNRRSG